MYDGKENRTKNISGKIDFEAIYSYITGPQDIGNR